jgi:hypothetical protein
MSLPQVFLVYSKALFTPRRWCIPDVASDIQAFQSTVVNGEAFLLLSVATPSTFSHNDALNAIAQANSISVTSISNGMCNVISGGVPIGQISADPAIDKLPNGQTLALSTVTTLPT